MREHLLRIAELDGDLHAFTAVREEAAVADAALIAESPDRRTLPLAGVPVAIKDNMDVAGMPTRHGSPGTRPAPAAADAEVVRRLRAAGAVILGKTAMSELAIWPFTEAHGTVTRNPVDPSRTCGGSSGGSAVAVAADMAALALGSDSGGSIRIPAACCGVVGLKPTPRAVPLPGSARLHWYGLTAVGPLARDVADASLMLDVLRGLAPPVRPAASARWHVAVSLRHPMLGAPVDPGAAAAVRRVAALLSDAGHRVEDDDPPYPLLPLPFLRCYLAGIADDANMLALDVEQAEPRTRAMVRRGRWIRRLASDTEAQAVTVARRMRQWVRARDVLLTPALAYPPPQVGRWTRHGWFGTTLGVARWMGFSPPWNLAGCPAAVIPAGAGADGIPVAVQLVAAVGRERLLLDVAAQAEALLAERR